MKYCVDEALESLSSVSQIEWHTEEFKLTKWSDDSGFGYVFRSHWNLVVGPNKVDSGKYYFAVERRNTVLNVR